MKELFRKLKKNLTFRLERMERSEKDTIKKALEASHLLGEAFDTMKKFILDYQFRDEAEEIDFFREKKPWICSRLIYYRKLYNIEMNRPVASVETQKEYLNAQMESLHQYTLKRPDFVRYYRSGQTYLDSLYFLRGQTDTEQYLETFYYELDPLFSTHGDFKVARILANDMLITYLTVELEKLYVENRKVFGYPPTRNG